MKLDELKIQLALGTVKWRTDHQRELCQTESMEDDIKSVARKFDSKTIFYILSHKKIAHNAQREFYEWFVMYCPKFNHKHALYIMDNEKLFNMLMLSGRGVMLSILQIARQNKKISIEKTPRSRRKKEAKMAKT